MSTFLELCQETDRVLASQGTLASVVTTGYQDLLVGYVQNAYTDIQAARKEWDFLHTSVDIVLLSGKTEYNTLDIFGMVDDPVANWKLDKFMYDFDNLKYVPYDVYIYEEWKEEDEPGKFSKVIENNTLIFEDITTPKTVTAYYYSKPQKLEENADVPLMPSQYDNAIIYRAVADVALKVGVPEMYYLFDAKANVLLGDLLRSQNPGKRVRSRGIA